MKKLIIFIAGLFANTAFAESLSDKEARDACINTYAIVYTMASGGAPIEVMRYGFNDMGMTSGFTKNVAEELFMKIAQSVYFTLGNGKLRNYNDAYFRPERIAEEACNELSYTWATAYNK
ncbi:MAG: hypothetical protein ACON37_09055 [Candidatus Puniceispirillaceae bacterium]